MTATKRTKSNPWADVPVTPRFIEGTEYISASGEKKRNYIRNPVLKGNGVSSYIPQMMIATHVDNNRKRTKGRRFQHIPRELQVPVGTDKKTGGTVYARVKSNQTIKVWHAPFRVDAKQQ
jgi:hypothetical protein